MTIIDMFKRRIKIIKIVITLQILLLIYGFFLLCRYYGLISEPKPGDLFFALFQIILNTLCIPMNLKSLHRYNIIDKNKLEE